MLGDYFVNPGNGKITSKLLLNKILFYLWNDVCKDGEGEIFKTSDTEDVSFSELHGDEGIQKLIAMMEYLGVSKFDNDADINKENRKRIPKYTINGSSNRYSTPATVQLIIEDYAKQHEDISIDNMIQLWNEISERRNCLVASWEPSPNDNQSFADRRRVEIKWNNKSVWLVTGWTEELFQPFIRNVKDRLGIVIERVE